MTLRGMGGGFSGESERWEVNSASRVACAREAVGARRTSPVPIMSTGTGARACADDEDAAIADARRKEKLWGEIAFCRGTRREKKKKGGRRAIIFQNASC